MTVCYYIHNLFRGYASLGCAFERMRIDPNVHLILGQDRCLCHLCLGNKITQSSEQATTGQRTGEIS
jgi:hypothetical protein